MGLYYATTESTPPTPPSGQVVVYPKSDKLMYSKDDAGNEKLLTSLGTLLSTGTASASNTLDFTGLTGYDSYIFVMSNLIPATGGASLNVRVSEDNGATFKAGGTDYKYVEFAASTAGASGANASTASGGLVVAGAQGNSATAGGVGGILCLLNAANSATTKFLTWQLARWDGTNYDTDAGMGLLALDQGAINALRFLFSSGAITSGSVRCYGIRST